MTVQLLRPGQRILTIPGHGLTVTQGRATLTAGGAWWLEGDVAAANAVAVYQPKGAASLAASYVNLANPGTYDAAPGTAPTFDAATGWTFTAASSQYLTTGITPAGDGSWSVLVRFSDAGTNQVVFGGQGGAGQFYLWLRTDNTVQYANVGVVTPPPIYTSGVSGFAGKTAYRDGTGVGTISVSGGIQRTIFIAAYNNAGAPGLPLNGKIQAVAIYDTTLTSTQVGLISTAMAAL